MAEMVSTITLCNVPINPANQIDFYSFAEQQQYFNSKAIHTYNDCKYTPRSGTLRVKGYVDSLNTCNYGFYTNTYNGTTKTYYFWIVAKNLLAKEVTELTIQIDTFQTWMFDITFRPCMIEREHVSDDTFGKHTIQEDFELGDYVTVTRTPVAELQTNLCYFIGVTDADEGHIGTRYGKTYSGFRLRYYDYADIDQMTNYIVELCSKGKGDSIAFIFTYPKAMTGFTALTSGEWVGGTVGTEVKNVIIDGFNRAFTFRSEEYVPKNNKLFCYPYNFLTITSPSGGNVVLKYELFSNSSLMFRLDGVLTQNSKFTLTPYSYAGKSLSYEDSIELSGFGLCSWNNDNYANWYANNQNTLNAQSSNAYNSAKANLSVAGNNYSTNMENANLGMVGQLANTTLSVIGNAAMGNIGGAISSGLGGVANAGIGYAQTKNSATNDLSNSQLMTVTNYENQIRGIMASVHDASVQPNTCKGDTSACGLDVARDTNTFFINQTMIKPEFARMIDQYFQMYGYKVNRVAVPNYKKRGCWDFIKTVNCNVVGNIPFDDRRNIEGIFNCGITVWHDDSFMYDYSLTNTIIAS